MVKVPKGVDLESACSMIVQGMTAHYLVKSTWEVKKGDKVLVHAAAGGMGLILCSLCKHLGATVIGTCSTEEKAKIAKEVSQILFLVKLLGWS
jgi:NADPH2:quinone reductase